MSEETVESVTKSGSLASGAAGSGATSSAVLGFARTRRDRAMLSEWASQHPRVVAQLWSDDPNLDTALASLGHDVLVLPVRTRAEGRTAVSVLSGESASIEDLHLRAEARHESDFASFVRRQGKLALDRAERAEHGTRYKVPSDVEAEIIGSPRFDRVISELSDETGLPEPQVRSEAISNLDEMVAGQTRRAIDAFSRFGEWMARAYRMDLDTEPLPRLRELNKSSSLVFLPNHRSYMDTIVLRAALSQANFPPNHVLGGDNLNFFPMGPLLRRNSIVFIRRQFKGKPIYRAMLREYLGYLLRKRFNIEWYIEGGRTRTGKLRPPRYGVLSYLMDAFAEAGVDDVVFVPVSVVYDQQHEVAAISAEEGGGSKNPESAKFLIRYLRDQSRRLGMAHLRFGEPLGLRSVMASVGSDDPRAAVSKVALEVAHRINQVTPITPTALLTFSLLGNDDRAITVEEGRRFAEPLLKYVHERDLPLTRGVDLRHTESIEAAMATLITEGVVERFEGGTAPVYKIASDRQREAAFYRNTVIHFFVTRAITELAVMHAAEESPDASPKEITASVWAEARRLRDLLKFEFFFAPTAEFSGEVAAEVDLAYPGWQEDTFASSQLTDMLIDSGLVLAPRVIGAFLEAYLVAAERLAERGDDVSVDAAELVVESLGVAQMKLLQHELHSPESVSKDLFSGAMQLAANRDLLDAAPGVQERRIALREELKDAVRRVQSLREASLRMFSAIP